MPDPIFESFRQPVEVVPPEVGEIRRRGERRRRRTAIATVVGAVVAVAAVIVPVAALTGGESSAPPITPMTPSPTPTSSPTTSGVWQLTVPENFPLGDGLPMPGEATAPVRHDEGTTVAVCGGEVWSAEEPVPWTDVATATNADDVDPADGADSRTLALYPDAETAKQTLSGLEHALDVCPATTGGDPAGTADRVGDADAWVLRLSAVSRPVGQLVTFTRVGNALLVQTDDVADVAALEQVEEQLGYVRAGQAAVVEAMCVFAADPCASSDPSAGQENPDDPTVAHVDEIPSSFPIDAAYDDPGSDGEVSTPSQDGDGVIVDPCGADALTVPEQDRLAFQVTYPEGVDARELRTYPTADDAVTQMERLRAAIAACPRQDASEPDNAASWTPQDVDTGYDSFAAAMTYDQGLGGGAWLFTRVGRSVLAVAVGGEFSRESVWDALPTLVDRTSRIAPGMCLFTNAGCSP